MKVERVEGGTTLFDEAVAMLKGYVMDVEGIIANRAVLEIYLEIMAHSGYVYAVSGGGFMVVDWRDDTFHRNKGHWIITMAYVVPEKRRSSILGRLLRTVKELHKGEIRAMSYRGKDADPVMAKRFKHIGNIYIV